MEVLAQQSECAYMVRQSSSNPGSYALSLLYRHTSGKKMKME